MSLLINYLGQLYKCKFEDNPLQYRELILRDNMYEYFRIQVGHMGEKKKQSFKG